MRKLSWVALLAGVLQFAVAHAATQIVDPGTGKLTGATNVDVGGTLYDVSFVDGSCVSLFSGCTASSFTFHSQGSADLASQALLDQVLVDVSVAQNFDSAPGKTRGISAGFGNIFTPYSLFGPFNVLSSGAHNTLLESQDLIFTFPSLGQTGDTTSDGTAVYAVWNQSPVAAVPEPEIYAMMGLGLGLLGWVGRRKKLKEAAAA